MKYPRTCSLGRSALWEERKGLPRSHRNVGNRVRLGGALHDAGDDLVGAQLVAALQAARQQLAQGRLPLHRRRQLRARSRALGYG